MKNHYLYHSSTDPITVHLPSWFKVNKWILFCWSLQQCIRPHLPGPNLQCCVWWEHPHTHWTGWGHVGKSAAHSTLQPCCIRVWFHQNTKLCNEQSWDGGVQLWAVGDISTEYHTTGNRNHQPHSHFLWLSSQSVHTKCLHYWKKLDTELHPCQHWWLGAHCWGGILRQ